MSISVTVPFTDQEEIFTTLAPIPLTASPPLRIFGASSYALLSTFSISLNALLITILLKNRKQYKKEPFFLLTWQLIACDVLTQIMQLIIAVPITYAGSPIYGEGLLLHSLGFIDTVAYYGTLFFSALMTVNRATIFFLPKINQALFTLPNIYGSIVFTWILLFVAPISLNAAGCYKNFATNGYYLYHDCQTPFSKQVYQIWYNIVAYLPVAMIVTYITIFVYLRYITRSASSYMSSQDAAIEKERANRRREQRLLFQSFLICGSLEIQNLAFNYLPYLNLQGQWSLCA
ncbi:serpentine type 7TM GPCR chemoreceptor srx domain-containing protein [Ditylenchus destructor]|nr:serpentine type 7TM GPCR chemoreceptor srx domain-containing protein [Ditylenchus destructor]